MKKQIHPNFIKSSNLILVSVGIGLINFFYVCDILTTRDNISIAVLSFLLIAGLGYLARLGKVWVKYFILVMIIWGLIGMSVIIHYQSQKLLVGVIIIPQTVLQVWALILLFKAPKTISTSPVDNNYSERVE